ncbi:MAG: class I SAM-dependent methyltransferase [Pseudomonadota bacterium]
MSLALRRIWRAPAVQALLLQCAAFGPTLLAVALLTRLGLPLSYGAVALIQGGFAAALSWWRGLASWWRAIQLLFPLTVYSALALALPPWLFLVAFLLLLLVYWSTFRTQVPYYPSGARVWRAVEQQLAPDRALRVIDIGSGLGGFALYLARRLPLARIEGIELAPLPWLVASLRARFSASRARFVLGDYERLDFAHYDAVFAYLSPAAMSALWRKAAREMRPGSILLSYEFGIAERAPNLDIVLTQGGPRLYVWHF